MFRHLTKTNIVVLILISLLLGGIIRFAFQSQAALRYKHTFAIKPAGVGTVYDTSGDKQKDQINCNSTTLTKCSFSYIPNTATYSYRAEANSGYTFYSWVVKNLDKGTTNTYLSGVKWAPSTISLRRDINYSVVANFVKTPSGQGTVTTPKLGRYETCMPSVKAELAKI